MDSYIICATPRTGSTLLCGLLAATGVAGEPDSFFSRNLDPIWARRWGLPAPDGRDAAGHAAAYLEAAIRAGRGPTEIFGLRIMQRDFGDLLAMVERAHPGHRSDRDRLEAAFGRSLYVHLSRGDKLAQAVSAVKAEQTGLWHVAPDGTEVERLAPPRAPEYDADRIAAKLSEIKAHDAAWRAWFEGQGIAPLRVDYERLAADPAAVVLRLCSALGVSAPDPARLQPDVARMADAVSLDWMRRYRRETGIGNS